MKLVLILMMMPIIMISCQTYSSNLDRFSAIETTTNWQKKEGEQKIEAEETGEEETEEEGTESEATKEGTEGETGEEETEEGTKENEEDSFLYLLYFLFCNIFE